MKKSAAFKRLVLAAGALLVAIVLAGCGESETQPAKAPLAQDAPGHPAGANPQQSPQAEPERPPATAPKAAEGLEAKTAEKTGPQSSTLLETMSGRGDETADGNRLTETEEAKRHVHPPEQPGTEGPRVHAVMVDISPSMEVPDEPRKEKPVEPAPLYGADPIAPEVSQFEPVVAEDANQPRDLGPPLVDDPKSLIRLDPDKPLWMDRKNRRVVLIAEVCLTEGALEYFACLKDSKEHESVLTVDVEAKKVHIGLLAVGAKVGHPVRFDPMYVAAAGSEIEVTVSYRDQRGKIHTARAQDWVLDTTTEKVMTHPWVFAGSTFWQDERTGKRHYAAEAGDLICVSNFSTAMLDLPIRSSESNNALMFQANREKIPPLGTPVTLVLKPKKVEQKQAKPEKPPAQD